MGGVNTISNWIFELLPLCASLFAFVFGSSRFFKKGKPLCMQSVATAMGCYAMGAIYRVCHMLTISTPIRGFSPAFFGTIGFFLFFVAATYGQMDKIVDDGSPCMKPAKIKAFAAPLTVSLLYVPIALFDSTTIPAKVTCTLIWIVALFSSYFTFKHALIPDLDFGFIKAIKPFNICATCLTISKLILLMARMIHNDLLFMIGSVLFSVFIILTIIFANEGVKKWII